MLKVYVAAISAFHNDIDKQSVRKNNTRRLNPPHSSTISILDLALVLKGLTCASFEPLQSATFKVLSFKTVLLLALTSVK